MVIRTMCHHIANGDWSRDTEENRDEEPSLPEQEPAEDVEILTDGGDDE